MPIRNLSILIINQNRIRASIIEDDVCEVEHLRICIIVDVAQGLVMAVGCCSSRRSNFRFILSKARILQN